MGSPYANCFPGRLALQCPTGKSTLPVSYTHLFTDGGEMGLGAEIGISTQKLHARGPMGVGQLVSYKYVMKGNGQIR